LTSSDPDRASRLIDQALAVASFSFNLLPGFLGDEDPEDACALADIAAVVASSDPDRARQLTDRALAANQIHDDREVKAQALAKIAYVRTRLAGTIEAVDERQTALGLPEDRIQSLDAATGNAMLWHFAQLIVTFTNSLSERTSFIRAILAAGDW
jgi:protein involved in temperature-dependent protein secretion